ncbi:MAG: efflux RND transporter periplasmic adaptor subunit [Cytophagales bacterium]|nr:efflux RND transporter periplasmic adaptor subunit [Cytophagales bacterium]
MKKKLLFLLAMTNILLSCNGPVLNQETKVMKRNYLAYLPEVKVDTLVRRNFYREVISNGFLEASRKSLIKPTIDGQLKKLNVHNGLHVKQGSTIAILEDEEILLKLKKNQLALAQASIELEDQLVNYGVPLIDTIDMDPHLLRNFKVKSGYSDALVNVEESYHELRKTRITAPFSGKIANLSTKRYDQLRAGEDLCLLIDDSKFEVVFSVTEAELALLEIGMKIQVKPFAVNGRYYGTLSEINPIVDNNGLIKVKATIDDRNELLMQGLHVTVLVQHQVPDQLVIPKDALVLREGRKVVFTLREDSIAYWNYVETGFENVKQHTIKSGLSEGELVIVAGSLNLAHESKVKNISND